MAIRVRLIIVLFILYSHAYTAQGSSPKEQAERFVDRGLALSHNSDAEAGYYLKAIEADASYAAPYFNLGFVYQSRGELEKAIESYSPCIELDGQRADAHRNLATCLLAVRRDAALYEVRHHLNLAVEIQKNLPHDKLPPASLRQQCAALLDVERRIHDVLKPALKEGYTVQEIVHILSRPMTRGGM